MNEIKVSSPTVTYTPAKVLYDFTNLDADIVEVEKRYKNWLPSEEEIEDANKTAKDINGVATDLNNEKVKIKKVMNSESKKFEDEVMNRVNKLKNIRQSVLDNLDVYEQKRIKERTTAFQNYVEGYCKEVRFEVPFTIVFESKVTNKSCTEKQWKEIAKRNVDNHKLNFDLLSQMDVENKELLQSIYMNKWDRMAAIDEYDAQMAANKKAEELRKQKEQTKAVAAPTITIDDDAPFDIPLEFSDVRKTWKLIGKANLISQGMKYLTSLGIEVIEV